MSFDKELLDFVIGLPLHGVLTVLIYFLWQELRTYNSYIRSILDRLLAKELEETQPNKGVDVEP